MKLNPILVVSLASLCWNCHKSSTPDSFRIEKGFTLTRVAAEPLVKDPVDLEFNERGDALVLEMPGYPFEDKQSQIIVLIDNDRDGVYDDKKIFAQNLQLANSFLPYKKGVLVAAPPYLLFVHDDDENYVVEKIDTLMGGFSTGNLQHNYNSLTYGLDNWIYAANGGNDGKPYWWGDSTSVMDLRGQDFRFELETKKLERIGESSGGFGLGMDEAGRLFETHNTTHISHLVFPDRYIDGKPMLKNSSLENISDHEENGLARIYPIGEQESRVNHPEQSGYFSGSCGITYYGGGALGDDYKGTVWVCDVVLNLIHVDKIRPNGSSFTASRLMEKRDFLASKDRSFRPVNLTVGPDGAMYVVDMHRKVIEHPEWIPDDIEKTLDMNAGKDQGRIYRITKSGITNSFDFNPLKTEQGLVNTLSHPNQWVRKTAHRLLMEKTISKETVDALKQSLTDANAFRRLHALYVLGNKNMLLENELSKALEDESSEIKEASLQISEKYFDQYQDLIQKTLQLLSDGNNRVRMQAALTLSAIGKWKKEKLEKTYFDALMATSLQENDTWNLTALTLAADHHASQLFEALVQNKFANTELLASLALRATQTQEGLNSVLANLSKSNLPNAGRHFILEQANKSIGHFSGKEVESSLLKLEQTGDLNVVAALASLRNKLNLPPSQRFLTLSRSSLQKVLDKTLPDSVRIQQMSLMNFLPYKEKSNVLFECLDNHQPLKMQEMALRQLNNYGEVEIGERIVNKWKELSPQTRRYSSDLLLYNEVHHDALLTGLENGTINIGEMNFDLERRRMLLWWTDNENTKQRAQKLFSDSGVTNRQEAINKFKPALQLTGSTTNGAKVFESICGNCHIYAAIGKEVGPVLTEINRKSKETLLHDILDPNAAADPKYINHRLETNEGMVHMGIVAAETDKNITIMKMGGERVTIGKSNVKSFRSLGTSLMMEGLENTMTLQEMADLLEFLQKGNNL
jgi:putative membrane-bound dehydrogenase-like protein